MAGQLVLRLAPDLKEKLTRMAYREGKTTSLLVREVLENYVKERDISSYIEDLWNRTGKKLRGMGHATRDVDRAISEVRRRKVR